jgi:hypothetical protein
MPKHHMSQDNTIKPEYKTVRILAQSYFKLVELTGLFSAALGNNFSISETADMLLIDSYERLHPNLLKVIRDPKQVQQYREEVEKNLGPIIELYKHVKIKE